LLAQLDDAQFWQVHRSVIVNHRHIEAAVRIDEGTMQLRLRGRPETLPVAPLPRDSRANEPDAAVGRWPWALLAWLAFVVYGSLLPLDWQPLPWHLALDRLAAAPWHDFDVRQRADWVANGVLYAPLGLLLARQAVGHGRVRLVALVLAWWSGSRLPGLELAQAGVPPRSVSRNDLLAEAIGAGRVLAWPALRHRLGRWRAGWQAGRSLAAALLAPTRWRCRC
jgi:VanZ family protein